MTWARFDDNFPEHPKLFEHDAGGEVFDVPVSIILTTIQIRAVCYCSRNRTDGFIPVGALAGILAGLPGEGWPDWMISAKLWHRATEPCPECEKRMREAMRPAMRLARDPREKRGLIVHDYLCYNPSKRDVEKAIRQRAEAAKSRWGKGKRSHATRNATRNAARTRPASSPVPLEDQDQDLPPIGPPVSTPTPAPRDAENPAAPGEVTGSQPKQPARGSGQPARVKTPRARSWCPTCSKLLALLNELAGKKFAGSGKGLAYLHARHTEKGEAVVERVIRVKTWKWLGTDMEDYLRPETLFGPTKFDGYANESMPKGAARKFDPQSPADVEARAKLHDRLGRISPERRLAAVSFLEQTIRETEAKIDKLVPRGADGPAESDRGAVDALSKKLEDLRVELVFVRDVKGQA